MFTKFALLVLLVALAGVSGQYLSQQHTQQMVVTSRNISENVTALGMQGSHYAAAYPTVVGQPTAAAISLPGTFVNTTQALVYVNNGSAYAYVPPGEEISPSVALAAVVAGQPGIKVGIVSGGALISGMGQTIALMQPLPAAIPNGSMVYVARDVAVLVANTPPAKISQALPPALGVGGVLSPPATFNPGGTAVIAWTPSGANNPSVSTVSGPAPSSTSGDEGGGTGSPPAPSLFWLNVCSTTHTSDGTWDGCMIEPPDSTEDPTPWSALQLASDWQSENLNNSSPCTQIGTYALTAVMIHPQTGILTGQYGFECGEIEPDGSFSFSD